MFTQACILHYIYNNNTITDIITLQFTRKLFNFMHIISMQSSGAAIILSGSVLEFCK